MRHEGDRQQHPQRPSAQPECDQGHKQDGDHEESEELEQQIARPGIRERCQFEANPRR